MATNTSSLARVQQYQARLLDILHFMAQEESPSVDGVVRLLEGLCDISGAAAARLMLRGGERAYAAWGAWIEAMTVADRELLDAVYAQGLLELTPLENLLTGAVAAELSERISHVMALPVQARGRFLGIVWLGFAQPPRWEDDERHFVEAITLQLALAMATLHRLERHTQNATHKLPYDAILDSLRDAILMVDKHLVVRYLNPVAAEVLQINLDEAVGSPLGKALHDEHIVSLLAGTADPELARAFILRGELAYQPHLCDLMVEGVKAGQLLILSDVTHFKRQTENMTLFLQTVSHDLRSPLTAAKGFMDMLPMVGELNEKQRGMRERVLVSITDMTNLVEKVLDAGRLDPEMGAYQLRRELCDPVNIVEKVVSNLTPAAQKKNLTLGREVGDGIPMLYLDEMMIERALMNLVENAIKYTPEGGAIWVRAFALSHNLYFSVADNGLGIPKDKQGIIFDKGSRVRRVEHKSIRGSGLGLFIVRNVAQQHGGEATLYSIEGEGSEFRIMIPIAGQNLVGGTGPLKA